jgi:hypothetical protein
MADATPPQHAQPHDPHPWMHLSPAQVIDMLVYELYGPVSALGGQFERIMAGDFDADDLPDVLAQISGRVDDLGRLVVLLKRYSEEQPHPDLPPAAEDS